MNMNHMRWFPCRRFTSLINFNQVIIIFKICPSGQIYHFNLAIDKTDSLTKVQIHLIIGLCLLVLFQLSATSDLMLAYLDFYLGGDEKRTDLPPRLHQRLPLTLIFGGDGSYMAPLSLHNDNVLTSLISQVNIIFAQIYSLGFFELFWIVRMWRFWRMQCAFMSLCCSHCHQQFGIDL